MRRLSRSIVLTVLGTALTVMAGTTAAHAAPVTAPNPVSARSSCPSSAGGNLGSASTPKGAVKIYGHGWGHGMGMSQYGAQGAARLGCDYRTILRTYYYGSQIVKRDMTAPVVLNLAAASSGSRLNAESGNVRWNSSTRQVVQPRGTTWTVSRKAIDGRLGVALYDHTGHRRMYVPNAAVLTASHSGRVVVLRASSSSKPLRTQYDRARFIGSSTGIAVTETILATRRGGAVEKYLRGLGEVPVSWPTQALKAQVVAARTYLSTKFDAGSGAYLLSSGTADQVYNGYDVESVDASTGGNWRAAVHDTDREVIVDSSGRTIEALYSSSMGGRTENREYVWGRYEISYLQSVDDSRWDAASDNPYRNWSVGMTRTAFAQKFGFDSVSSWSVAARGSDQRLAGVRISGSVNGQKVTRYFTGADARYRLGLRSPGFTFG